MSRYLLNALGVLLLSVMLVPAVRADDGSNSRNVNPKILGKSYGEWSAEWWRWALGTPAAENPVLDETGEFCAVNQPSGKVWFLAGSFGVEDVERSCTIPSGKALFFPLITAIWTDCPPPSLDEELTDDEVRSILAQLTPAGDNACQLTSAADPFLLPDLFNLPANSTSSQQILSVRTQSPVFSVVFPEDSVSDPDACDVGVTFPPGESGRSISEGHWVMLPPFSPGNHVVELAGAGCDGSDFKTSVTYNLTVLGGRPDDDDDD